MISEDTAEIKARKTRFLFELTACDLLMKKTNEVLNRSEQEIKIRNAQSQRDLDLLVAAMHGKAGKTYQAILHCACMDLGKMLSFFLEAISTS